LGFGVAQVIDRPVEDSTRLVALEENLALLQRELILDRLQDTSATKRLRGAVDASQVVAYDPQVARALLDLATQDRSVSVRSAAIDALGSQMNSGDIGGEVMQLLEGAESPIVQLALVDLVLRHGGGQQIRQLQELADNGGLHPDLVRHVNNALRSQSI
jgi:HEAT repeat protein